MEWGFGGGPFVVTQPYARQFLQDNPTPYQGPFTGDNNAGKGLNRYGVSRPTPCNSAAISVNDFGSVVAATVFAPVPARRDSGEQYDTKPMSNGPYVIDRIEANGVRYLRNMYWAQGTDPVRKAYPDRVVVSVSSDAETLSDEIVSSEENWANTRCSIRTSPRAP